MPQDRSEYQRDYQERNRERLAQYKREWAEKNRERLAERRREREASMGPEALREYRRRDYLKHHAKRLQSRAVYRAAHKEEKERWYAANQEKLVAYSRKYYRANREAQIAAAKAWQERNRSRVAKTQEAYRAKHAKRRNTQSAEWRSKNPDKVTQMGAKRRLRMRENGMTGDRRAYATFVRFVKSTRQIGCYWCGKSVPKGERHIDHIVPLSRGGKDDVLNICCACKKCNLRKNRKTPENFDGQFLIAFVA